MTAHSARQRVLRQASWETGLLLRNGEQLLLTIIIPLGLLAVLTLTDLVPAITGPDGTRIASSLATVLSVSVLSAAFTSLAIATAFERRSGALRFLGTTPLTRGELMVGKIIATTLVMLVSATLTAVVAVVIGWRPQSGSLWVIPLLLLGTAAWAPWAIAMAGTLRAESVLALANGAFLLFLMFGGIVIPPESLPAVLASVTPFLPSGALTEGLSSALVEGSVSVAVLAVLAGWAAGGSLLAARTFRWS